MQDADDNNLLYRLGNYAAGQFENFVTEAFTHLLTHLLRHEPRAGTDLLNRLTASKVVFGAAEAHLISVATQITVNQKRPDIEVRAPNRLVYVEVKVEAPLGPYQLGYYRDRLLNSGEPQRCLVLLTRYKQALPQDQQPDVAVRWYQVANWLQSAEVAEPTSSFLIAQFITFLRRKGMALDHVDQELERGIPSLVSLMTMLQEVLNAQGYSLKTNVRWWDWFGFDVNVGTYYVGFYVNEPTVVRFRTYRVQLDLV